MEIVKKLLEDLFFNLSQITEYRKTNNDEGLMELRKFIDDILSNPRIFDFVRLRIGQVNKLLNNDKDKEIFKNILNYYHKKGDIFLYFDSNIYAEDDLLKIKFTIYRKIIETTIEFIIDPPYNPACLMSKKQKTFYKNKLELLVLIDYEYLGLNEIPPYRVWNKQTKKMTYYKGKNLNNRIKYLNNKIDSFVCEIEVLSENDLSLVYNYHNLWVNEYKNEIDNNYPELRHNFNYYNGIELQVIICRNGNKLAKEFNQTYLNMCTGKRKSEYTKINVHNEIKEITFFDNDFDESFDVIIDIGYNPKFYDKDKKTMIIKDVKREINTEILSMFFSTINKKFFKTLSIQILQFMGFNEMQLNGKKYIEHYNVKYSKHNLFELQEFYDNTLFDMTKAMALKSEKKKIVILSNNIISKTIRKKFKRKNNIMIFDFQDIKELTENYSKNLSFFAILYKNIFFPSLLKLNEKFIIPEKNSILLNLRQKLIDCPLGTEGWQTYENLCSDIISTVFKESFDNFLVSHQVRNLSGTDIKDIIINNNSKLAFWSNVRHFYNCNNIVIECKNTKNQISNDELRQISDYLEKDSTGQFGIIFSRKGLSSNGEIKQIDYLKNKTKKLILVLKDENVINLIDAKISNSVPENILDDIKFEVELKC